MANLCPYFGSNGIVLKGSAGPAVSFEAQCGDDPFEVHRDFWQNPVVWSCGTEGLSSFLAIHLVTLSNQ